MWRRYIPKTKRPFDAMIRTNHLPDDGRANGREKRLRLAFDRILTNRTTPGLAGSVPNGCSFSRRMKSRPLQTITSASKWQLPEQFGTKLCLRAVLSNDKRACGTYIHDIIFAQFSCQHAWPKPSVSANIDASEENDESHSGDYREVPKLC